MYKDGKTSLEELYQIIFDSAPQPMWLLDIENHSFLAFNNAALKLYGYTAEEIQTLKLKDLISSSGNKSLLNNYTKSIREIHCRKDGTQVFVELKLKSIILNGKPALIGVVNDISDVEQLAKAEQELRRSREELSVILKSVADGITVQDKTGRLIYANDAAARVCGYHDNEALLASSISEILDKFIITDENGLPFALERLPGRLALKGFLHPSAIIKYYNPLSEIYGWSKIVSTPVFDENSNVRLAISVFHDITDLREAEEKIRLSETRFRLLVEQSPLIIQILSADGKFIQANNAWEEYFGISLRDLQGYNILNDRKLREKGIMPYILKAFTGETVNIPQVMHNPESGRNKGKTLWTRSMIYPVKNSEGTIKEVVLIHEDITVRKKDEEILKKSEEKYRTLVEGTNAVLFTSDSKGIITYANESAAKLLNLPVEEITGKFYLRFVHPEDRSRIHQQYIEQFITPESSSYMEFRYIDNNLESGWVSFFVSPVIENGQITGMTGVAQDITERKKAEENIAASLKEKEILLKEVHHRVKNNMQIVYSLLNLQSNSITDRKALDAFKESQNRIRSMALIHEKLYQTKELSRIDMPGYCRDLISYLVNSYLLDTGRIKVNLEIDYVEVDIDLALSLGLIINELLTNSFKYAFPENRSGNLNIYLRSGNNKQYRLIISDDGIGFPSGKDYKNTNTLGLQLVNTLVEQVDGQIEINSNNGTEFIITFSPARKAR